MFILSDRYMGLGAKYFLLGQIGLCLLGFMFLCNRWCPKSQIPVYNGYRVVEEEAHYWGWRLGTLCFGFLWPPQCLELSLQKGPLKGNGFGNVVGANVLSFCHY